MPCSYVYDEPNDEREQFLAHFVIWLRQLCGTEHDAALQAALSELSAEVTSSYRESFVSLPDEYLQAAFAFHRLRQWWWV